VIFITASSWSPRFTSATKMLYCNMDYKWYR